ncbi:MAG: hypothetical protein AAF633_18500 [Chloroflexota bacterium]
MSFNWETDDENSEWETPIHEETAQTTRGLSNSKYYFAFALLSGSVAILAFLATNRFVRSQEREIKEELIAAFSLLEETAVDRDRDIMTFMLSATDQSWNRQQLNLLSLGKLVDHSLPGYQLVNNDNDEAVNVLLSPDFTEAEVFKTYTYQGDLGVMQLTQTYIFRQGVERWLYTIPYDDYWGDPFTLEGDWVNLIYPGIDEPFAASLHAVLERETSKYCLATQRCPSGPLLTVDLTNTVQISRLSTPNLSMSSEQLGSVLDASDTLYLPSVTAYGTPADATSEELLFSHYASHVISRISYQIVGNLDGEPKLIDWAIVARQLEHLELPHHYNTTDVSFNGALPPQTHTWLWEYQSNWILSTAELQPERGEEMWLAQFYAGYLVKFMQFIQGDQIAWDETFQQSAHNTVTMQEWFGEATDQPMWQLETVYVNFINSSDNVAQ